LITFASLPTVVVLPVPLTPTMSTTCGLPVTIGLFVNPGEVPPAEPGQKARSNRSYEYDSLGDLYTRFLVEELLPIVEKKYKITTDPDGARDVHMDSLSKLTLPAMPAAVTPLVYAIPVQLIAYHTAVVMGTDVDQPRNLAKSVTVE